MCDWLEALLIPSTKRKPSISAFLFFGLTSLVWLPAPAVAQHEEQIQIVGDVTFSDGTLVVGAAVGATPICAQGPSVSQTKTTRQDGAFFFLVDDFAAGCDRFRLTVSKESDDWLPVTKIVQLQQGQTLLLTHLVLADRGGKLSIQVLDTAFNRFVYAQLDLVSKAAPGQLPFTTRISTSGNQTPTVKLIPPGEYTAQVRQYDCRSFLFFTSDVAPVSFVVKPALQVDEMVRIDVGRVKDISGSVPAACDPDKPAPPIPEPSVTVRGPSIYPPIIWGQPDNGLEIALGPGPGITEVGKTPSLALSLRNVGSQPLFIMTDGHCRGDRFGTSAIHLTLTDSSGKSSNLEYLGPSQKGCTPPLAMFTIALGPGVTTSVLINLGNYRPETDAPSSRDALTDWRTGGTFRLQARMASGTHRQDHWEGQGTAVSNQFEIHRAAQ